MRKLLTFLIALGAIAFAQSADAATCFWVGTGSAPGGGTWSTANTTNWASATNGANGSCVAIGGVPKQGTDIATFDSAANGLGGNTVTVDSTMNGASLGSVVAGTMNGTLDFSVNNPSLTLTTGATCLSFTGTGTRTIKLGSGTFTCTQGAPIDLTNVSGMTGSSFSSSTIVSQSSGIGAVQTFVGGGQTFGTLTIAARPAGQGFAWFGTNTFGTINITGPATVNPPPSTTTTIGTLNISGTTSGYVLFGVTLDGNTQTTMAVSATSISRAIFRNTVFTTAVVNPTNSIDAGNNNFNGGTLTNPPVGGGGIIGGGL